ncbi:MAG: UMP kinase [Thermoprotei archaeon]|nr:MAG: UMP kinase [Thermoprotei archaeon]
MKIVIKIGGHLLSTPMSIVDLDYVRELASVLEDIKRKHEMIIVTGGGSLSRFYIDALRKRGINEALCDLMGIEISRLNALFLSLFIGGPIKIPNTVEDVLDYSSRRKIIVMGGLQPGQSTTTTAAIIAETIKADLLIIATNVEGIYTRDPFKDPSAKKIDEITIDQLKEMFREKEVKAGTYPLIDYMTLRILERAKIPAVVVNGRPPMNIIRAIRGENIGTRIRMK